MKKITFLVLAAGMLCASCKKEPVKPSPAAHLRFGYRTGGVMSSGMSTVIRVEEYASQDALYTIELAENLVVRIREAHVRQEQVRDKEALDLSFTLPVRTHSDAEVFITGRNVHVAGTVMGVDPDAKLYEIGQDLVIPVRVTAQAVPGNGVLEINPAGDVLEWSYRSNYTGTSIRQDLKIKST